MSLQVLAVAALLVGSAAVLTVVATTPLLAPLALSGAASSPAGEGRLDIVVRNTADAASVRMLVTGPGGRGVLDERVDLPARGDWQRTLRVPVAAYDVRLEHLRGDAAQDGDLAYCAGGHAVSTMATTFTAGGVAGTRFKAEGVRCADGSPAGPAPDPDEPFRASGKATVGAGASAPAGPGCLAGCASVSYTFASGSFGFETERPGHAVVRAFWTPATPATEQLALGMYIVGDDGSGQGVAEGQGAREVVLEADLAEPGLYRLHAWPARPVGVAVLQEVNYEVTVTYG